MLIHIFRSGATAGRQPVAPAHFGGNDSLSLPTSGLEISFHRSLRQLAERDSDILQGAWWLHVSSKKALITCQCGATAVTSSSSSAGEAAATAFPLPLPDSA
jgi:hypothetical protein